MRHAKVLFKNEEAGILIQHDDGSFSFIYHDEWITHDRPSISLTLPRSEREFHSKFLFPFFLVCRLNRIDPHDFFSILMTTAKNDSIGAVRVIQMETK